MSVSKNLNKFEKDLTSKIIPQALTKACVYVQNSAIDNCPSDTGALRRSIDFQVAGGTGVIFSNLEYAPYVEIGTGKYSSRGGGRNTPWVYKSAHGFFQTEGQKPQPFLQPAIDTNKNKILQAFKGVV